MSNSQTPSPAASVERLAVEALPERPRRVSTLKAVETIGPASPPVDEPAPSGPITAEDPIARDAIRRLAAALAERRTYGEQVNAVFTAIAKMLAIRLQLLMALIGAFVLSLFAMRFQTYEGLAVVVAFCGLTILPLVWLEYSGRPRG